MEYFKQVIQGIYQFMVDVQVPVFDKTFPLWVIFLFGALGGFCVWFWVKFMR